LLDTGAMTRVVHNQQILVSVVVPHMLQNLDVKVDLGILHITKSRNPTPEIEAMLEDGVQSIDLGFL
jgi:hypothetical protein